MFGGACGQFVPSPGSVWDGMACKSCAKAKKDHKEFSEPSLSDETATPTTIGAPVAQDAIVIALPQMSASPSATSASSFAFTKPGKSDAMRSRVSSFKKSWTRERTVVAVVAVVILLLVIILAATLSGSAEVAGLSAQDQARLNTANSAMATAATKLGLNNNTNITITNSSDAVDQKAMASMLSSMGLDSMQFSDVSTTPPASSRTCVTDADCQSCDDPSGTCDKVLGRCSLAQYDANLYDADISGQCPPGICNFPYNHDVPSAITGLFQGFPTRKKYEINPLLEPESPDSDFGGLASLAPATVYYGNLKIRGNVYSTMFVLFVPDIEVSPDVAFALRINFKDVNNSKTILLDILPALNNIPGFSSSFDVCKGAIVFTSTSFSKMGFEVVQGANMFLRVRASSTSGLTLLEPYLVPANKRVFNMRAMVGETFEGDKGVFIDFQKDPNVGVNTRTNVASLARLGLQLDSASGALTMGTFSKFNFSENLQFHGGFTTQFKVSEGNAILNGYINDVVLPSNVKKYLTVNQMGFTMTSSLPAIVVPTDFETVGDVTLTLGDYSLELYVAGKFFTDGNCGFTTKTQLNTDAKKFIGGVGSSLTNIIAKVANVGPALNFLNNMRLPNSLVVEVSVASKDMEINDDSIPEGVRVMATLGFNNLTFPKEFEPIVSFLNLGTDNEVGVGALVPFEQPNQVSIFVSFTTTAGNSVPIVQFEAFTTRIKPVPPSELELSVTLQLNFPGNTDNGVQRPLKLVASGAFAPPTFLVQGAMIGEWRNVLGVSGLNIIDMGGLIGFGAGGINAIGAWGTVDLGLGPSVNFTIVISPAQGQFAWDTHVADLSFKSVFQISNQMTNSNIDVPDAVIEVLSPISIDYMDITVCPQSFSIGGRDITAGFSVNGSITFLGANVRLSAMLGPRLVQIKGIGPETVQDLTLAFGVSNVNVLAPVLPLVNFATWVMPLVRNSLSKYDRVCLPAVCDPTPFDAGCAPTPCASTDLSSQLDSVVAHINSSVGSLLAINQAQIQQLSVWDLMNGGGPNLNVVVAVNGQTISGSVAVTTDFFIQDKLTDAYPIVATAVTNALNGASSTVVNAVEAFFCDYLKGLACYSFPSKRVCMPVSFC